MATSRQPLARNRAEELGFDVWDHFVIPPYFSSFDLSTTFKPRVIVGGRGCGKTMLLRYLSHDTLFSTRRSSVPSKWMQQIGLYWKADIQFAAAMSEREVAADIWMSSFDHLLALKLGTEVVRCLKHMAKCSHTGVTRTDIGTIKFGKLKEYLGTSVTNIEDLEDCLRERTVQLEMWVSNVRQLETPRFLPGVSFLEALIGTAASQVPQLTDAVFFVFVDEYENLQEYQQEALNTAIKRSQRPLIFNLAMKRYGFRTTKTTGGESLQAIADYREHDLEENEGSDFERFAAEVFIHNYEGTEPKPIPVSLLRDPESLVARQEANYVRKVKSFVSGVLPSRTEANIANGILQTSSLKRTLVAWIERGLEAHQWKRSGASSFIDNDFPQASIVVPALLNRRKPGPQAVLDELAKLQSGQGNRFTGSANWIHNNLFGCILYVYEPFSQTCPLYAGFGTYCRLSNGNMRHFLELCFVALTRAENRSPELVHSVDPQVQAEAARSVSSALIREVRGFGNYGNLLYRLTLCLGSLFAMAQRRPTQSEPEQNHFIIKDDGPESRDPRIGSVIKEALKWSVLFEDEETKHKTEPLLVRKEYVLNPVYSPYFHVSYRKKRKLELSVSDIQAFVADDYSIASAKLKEYAKRWSIDVSAEVPPLFAHLDEAD